MILDVILVIFLAALAIQLVFYIGVFTRLLSYNQLNVAEIHSPVSVIVCAHNEIAGLKELIPRMAQQNYPFFEIIVVDDRSDDGSWEFLIEQKDRVENLIPVKVQRSPDGINPKKFALMQGIEKARNVVLLLTDADCVPASRDWISSMSNGFLNGTEIVLGYSPYRIEKDGINPFIRMETLYTGIQYLNFCLAGSPYMGVGRNLAYRKSLFEEGIGFKNIAHLTGGDDDLFVNGHARSGNTRIVIGETSATISRPKKNLSSYLRQKKRHFAVGKFYRWKDKIILSLLSLSHILFWASFIILALAVKFPLIVLIGFLIRFGVTGWIFYGSARKLGDRINLQSWLTFDFFYPFFLLYTGGSAFFSKKIAWN